MNTEITLSNNKDAFLLTKDIPAGVSFAMPEIIITKGFGADTAVTIAISIASGIPSSLVASWLYDKLKQGRSGKITINRREIHFEDGEITRIIEEAIDIKR